MMLEELNVKEFCSTIDLQEEMNFIHIAFFLLFLIIFGQQNGISHLQSHFYHQRIVQKNFQLKIPILGKNDVSATQVQTRRKFSLMQACLEIIKGPKNYFCFTRQLFQSFLLIQANSETFDHPSLLNKVGLFWNF